MHQYHFRLELGWFQNMTNELDEMDWLSIGKRTRLHRLMYDHGPGNGKLLILPIDQGIEHGPSTFFPNPESASPDYQYSLAEKGNYSGIALHLGLAEKYSYRYADKNRPGQSFRKPDEPDRKGI